MREGTKYLTLTRLEKRVFENTIFYKVGEMIEKAFPTAGEVAKKSIQRLTSADLLSNTFRGRETHFKLHPPFAGSVF